MTIHTLLVLGFLAIAGHQNARERTWQTTVNLQDGSAVLHWQGVYEGKDTVTRIEIRRRGQRPVSIDVEGQPVFSAAKTFVALPYCADDGCLPVIEIVDLTNARKLKPIRLAEQGQYYFSCRWAEEMLRVVVESGEGATAGRQRTYQFPVSGQR